MWVPVQAYHARLTANHKQALPDRPPQPVIEPIEDDSDSGGVALEEPQPPPSSESKQTSDEMPEKAPASTEPSPEDERRYVWIEGAVSSYNMGDKQPSTASPAPPGPLPSIDLNRGDLAAARHHFTPIVALSKYPYKFCDKPHFQDIASALFDQGKFWNRQWDL
jgi:hypothetical protein